MSIRAEVLIKDFRTETFDNVEPYFWEEDEILRLLDIAQKKFCRVGVPILDSSSPITQLSFSAGDTTIPYDDSITRIRTARLTSTGGSVHIGTQDNFTAAQVPDNTLTSPGRVRDIFIDYEEELIRFSRPADKDDELQLHVERKPLEPLTACTDNLEAKEDYHQAILQWALFRAYSKQDAETFDMAKADSAKAEFYAEVAEAKRFNRKRHGRMGTMSYGGI